MGQPMPRIMHFQGPSEIDLSGLRYRGCADALRKHGLPVDSSLVIRCESITREEGFRMMNRCIVQGTVPDALFGFNDQLAIGAMKALKRKGFHVPQQVSVMGFTESQSALVTEPMLSSVAQPLDPDGGDRSTAFAGEDSEPCFGKPNRCTRRTAQRSWFERPQNARCRVVPSFPSSFGRSFFGNDSERLNRSRNPFPLIYCRRRSPKKVYSEYICFCKALSGPSDSEY